MFRFENTKIRVRTKFCLPPKQKCAVFTSFKISNITVLGAAHKGSKSKVLLFYWFHCSIWFVRHILLSTCCWHRTEPCLFISVFVDDIVVSGGINYCMTIVFYRYSHHCVTYWNCPMFTLELNRKVRQLKTFSTVSAASISIFFWENLIKFNNTCLIY